MNNNDDDDWDDDDLFADEDDDDDETINEARETPWKVLIVDDEADVHATTKLALRNVIFENRGLEFVSAYSGAEAITQLQAHDDTALILLDVVMEEDDAGLQVAKKIRDDLGNDLVRIILRTGQPGQAPEKQVILDYDINDYKAKTELTTTKLFTTVISALRSYRDLHKIAVSKAALLKIVEASASIFNMQSLHTFIEGILAQMTSILPLSDHTMVLHPSSLAANMDNGEYIVLAGTGTYSSNMNTQEMRDEIPEYALNLIEKAFQQKQNVFSKDNCALYIQGNNENNRFVTYFEGYGQADEWERNMIDIFCNNLSIAYDNAKVVSDLREEVRCLKNQNQ